MKLGKCITVLSLLTLWAVCVSATTYDVTNLVLFADLVGRTAEPGDVIELQPGLYALDVPRIPVRRSGTPQSPIIIRGVMTNGIRPVIDASRVNVKRSVLWVVEVQDIIIENLEIRNAAGSRFSDRECFGDNATAIYFCTSTNITARNCWSHHNEDGFFANTLADYILIENCDIGFNGTQIAGEHAATHNFYFCARHQMVKNSYIHNSYEGENFKSRGENVIFAFNWVDEDASYSVAVDSGGSLNTLWLGNVVMKRTTGDGSGQGRLLGIGDGSGTASGKLVAVNNTFVSVFPHDYFLFTEKKSSCDAIFVNNAFVGPGQVFARHEGKGAISGTNNWISSAVGSLPDALTNSLRGADAGFADSTSLNFRPGPGSPLKDAGADGETYLSAIRTVTANSRGGTEAVPSPAWLKALDEIEKAYPAYEPGLKSPGFHTRIPCGPTDIGAYEAAGN